jgi:hypothetical protein
MLSVGDGSRRDPEDGLVLGGCHRRQTGEFVAKSDVGIEFVVTMLVEVQEAAAAQIEAATRLLLEPLMRSQLPEQRL